MRSIINISIQLINITLKRPPSREKPLLHSDQSNTKQQLYRFKQSSEAFQRELLKTVSSEAKASKKTS